MIAVKNFDRLKMIQEDKDILLTNDYKSFSYGKDKIFINGIFMKTDSSRPYYGRFFPRRDYFERADMFPLFATGFSLDARKYDYNVHASFLYDTDLSIFMNENMLSSTALEPFVVAQEPINSDTDAIIYTKAVHEVGHSLISVIEAGNKTVKGYMKLNPGYSTIGADRDKLGLEVIESRIREALGGVLAEELILGNWRDGGRSDFLRVGEGIIDAVRIYGDIIIDNDAIFFQLPGDRPIVRAGNAVNSLTRHYLEQTRKLLFDKQDLIKHLSDRLIEETEIQAERFVELINNFKKVR